MSTSKIQKNCFLSLNDIFFKKKNIVNTDWKNYQNITRKNCHLTSPCYDFIKCSNFFQGLDIEWSLNGHYHQDCLLRDRVSITYQNQTQVPPKNYLLVDGLERVPYDYNFPQQFLAWSQKQCWKLFQSWTNPFNKQQYKLTFPLLD